MTEIGQLLKAVCFSAHKHQKQRRKDEDASPYINHPIEVSELLANAGEVSDLPTLLAAILHDTVEDTDTTFAELERLFGCDVRLIVAEMTDDKTLPKDERKRLQIEHARQLSARAKQIKIADKICNVRDVIHTPPPHWSGERRREYLQWAKKVVEGCRGSNANLERRFDEVFLEGWRILEPCGDALLNSEKEGKR